MASAMNLYLTTPVDVELLTGRFYWVAEHGDRYYLVYFQDLRTGFPREWNR